MQKTIAEIQKITFPIFQKVPSLGLAYIFGSLTTPRRGPLSDIDIGIFLTENLAVQAILTLELDLLGELTSALNSNDIDLTIMNLAPNSLNFEIIKCNCPLFVKDEELRIDVESRIHSQYLDWRFHENLFNQIYLRQITEKDL